MRTTLLLGAGASAFAGIPTTTRLVETLSERLNSVDDQHERPTARFFALNVLEETNPEDVEDLYEFVARMLDAEEIHQFVTTCKLKGWGDIKRRLVTVGSSPGVPEGEQLEPPIDEADDTNNAINTLKSIKSAIRDTLLEKCMVGSKQINNVKAVYDSVLEPLGIRDVLTTNYDNVIETYCEEARIPLANGFEQSFHGDRREWTGKFEESESGALRLVKMHGSVTWQRDGDAVLELGRPGARGEEYDVMIYPEKGPKRYDKTIFPELARKFSSIFAYTDLLVVIGYSFRDEEVNYMIKHHLATGGPRGEMRLLYLDPKPNRGMSNLMGTDISPKIVRTSTSNLLKYSVDDMPYVYASDMKFGTETSYKVKFAVDAVSEISPMTSHTTGTP